MNAASSVPPRVLAIVAPVCVAGVATIVAACVSYAQTSHSVEDGLAVAGLFLGMVVAERFPVPVEGVDAGGVTLGFVFAVAAIVLFGWQAGVLVAAGGPTVTHLIGRRPPLRVAYNGSMFALAALAGGLVIEPIPETSVGGADRAGRDRRVPLLLGRQPGADQRGARGDSGKPFLKLIVGRTCSQTTAPFALMASAALMLVVLWERSPAALDGARRARSSRSRSTSARRSRRCRRCGSRSPTR